MKSEKQIRNRGIGSGPVNPPTDEVTPEPVKTVGESLMDLAVKDESISSLPAGERDKAIELLDLMFKRMDAAHNPDLKEGGSIEMGLAKGGTIKIVEATGYHIMQAKREMQLHGKNGDMESMLPVYAMVACADIDDKPMTMADVADKLTARDFNVLLSFFQRINLL